MCAEPLKIIESVPDNLLNDYRYLKQRKSHFSFTEMGQREKFRNLAHKFTQTFLDCSVEVQLVLEDWLKGATVNRFEDLNELMVKDCILAAVPCGLGNFLIEQTADTLKDIKTKGIAFYDTNKYVCWVMTAELNINAASTFQSTQMRG